MTIDSPSTEIIAGDFNLLPETASVRMFAERGLRDLIAEFDIPTTRNDIVWDKFPADMKQLHADYAFVYGDDVEYDFCVEDVRVSDHLPLVVELSLAPRQAVESVEQLTVRAV